LKKEKKKKKKPSGPFCPEHFALENTVAALPKKGEKSGEKIKVLNFFKSIAANTCKKILVLKTIFSNSCI
jgi:hypothetical protein